MFEPEKSDFWIGFGWKTQNPKKIQTQKNFKNPKNPESKPMKNPKIHETQIDSQYQRFEPKKIQKSMKSKIKIDSQYQMFEPKKLDFWIGFGWETQNPKNVQKSMNSKI
jgi:hypothetical protein